jgi:hypothetical protein
MAGATVPIKRPSLRERTHPGLGIIEPCRMLKNADFTRGPNPRCCCGCGFLSRINEAWIENGNAVFTFAIHAKGGGNSR